MKAIVKLISVATVIAISVVCLVGCGSSNSTVETTGVSEVFDSTIDDTKVSAQFNEWYIDTLITIAKAEAQWYNFQYEKASDTYASVTVFAPITSADCIACEKVYTYCQSFGESLVASDSSAQYPDAIAKFTADSEDMLNTVEALQ